MNTEYSTASASPMVERKARRRTGPSPIIFLAVWVILIATGVLGAVWYTDKIKQDITADVGAQTSAQITAMQQDYNNRITQLETQYQADLTTLQGKVDALNELLQFSKDNISSKTDNSNQLFTQLSAVQKQLDELKKNLDVLK
ncbi:peptidoglycan hydrolase CwlO-like protein [Paenibacillus phyllosphaerae]|uniref:Peptidoglycan hydrolase CwlO-like protein n=1 Tax=Paenibacillus phyllosphaerae TaxID=274593 RepID=A0A7W5FKU6_9BACL|nr:hypothetical protein [Paenibacillus phyllosphaerae]MBB3108491.1 peptidoglycan hydrolase CwlO-like protein [Paenibacillus phyllosphaerae]